MASRKKILGGLVVLVVMLFAVSAFAAGAIVEYAVKDAQDAGQYWTKERMMNAQPMQKVLTGTPPDLNQPIVDEGPVRKSSGAKAGSLASATEDQVIEMSGTLGGIDEQLTDSRYVYPPPYTVFAVPSTWYSMTPYRQTGKVFFKQSGLNYVCSGSSVGGRLVLTAGHCVNAGGHNGTTGAWSVNFTFAPRYYNGSAPDGLWTSATLVTTTSWAKYSKLCGDWAFAVMNTRDGVKLSAWVGYLGFMTSASRLQHWTQLGYPAASPFNGMYMYQTEASYNGQDNTLGCTPYTTAKGFGQAGGSSGGPWITVYKPGNAGAMNYANSVTSYIYTSQPKLIYGPYFDSLTWNTFNQYKIK